MSAVFINEFHYDNDGIDTGEFVEIAVAKGTDLTGWSLVLYNGNGGTAYATVPLDGLVPAPGTARHDFLTIAFPTNGIQNGAPDGLALVDDAGEVVQFLSYEGSFSATDGAAIGLGSTDIGVSEPGDTPVGLSLQYTGTDSTNGIWQAPLTATAGAENEGQTFGPPPIFDLQITEIWPGNEPGDNLTEDWFEITNLGAVAWVRATDGDLFYDDNSASAEEADPITGIETILPGESVLVLITDEAGAIDEFFAVWADAISLAGVQIGQTDGAGLGQGGDQVTLFIADGTEDEGGGGSEGAPIEADEELRQIDAEAYPDAEATGGQSWDVALGAFSVAGVAGAVASTVVNDADQAAQGSPGDGDPVVPAAFTLELLHFADQEAGSAAVFDAPRLSAVLNALRAEDLGKDGLADNTLTLSSGDAYIPGLFFSASQAVFGAPGVADILIQNELGVQAIAFGNHEFDQGTARVRDLIQGGVGIELDGTPFQGTDFPYLSTNLDFSTDPNLAPLVVPGGGAPLPNAIASSVVIEVNGEPIGVVGATTPTLASISSPGSVGIAPSPFGAAPTDAELDALAAIIQAEVDALLDANPALNKVILLAHMQQIAIERALAARLENVDIIVAGGSNTRLFDDNDRARPGDSDQGQYPEFITNAGGTTTALVNTDGNYKYVGRLVLDFDADGNVIAESYDEQVSGAYATDDEGVAALGAEGLVDPEVQAIADAIGAQIVVTEGNVFGISEAFLNGERAEVRREETNLGNLTADANLAYAQELASTLGETDPVVVSIKNGGGIRASIGQIVVPPGGTGAAERLPTEEILDAGGAVVKPAGGISQNDIGNALSFNNALSLLTLTTAELAQVLEHGVATTDGVNAPGPYPQVAGVRFSYDDDLPSGQRILNAGVFAEDGTLIAEIVRDGEVVDNGTQTFRIVTLTFLADGGDGYPFPSFANTDRVDLDTDQRTGAAIFADDGTEQDALAEYLAANFLTTPFTEADTARDEDLRIQNLDFTVDTVFGVPVLPTITINEVRINVSGTEFDFVELVADDPAADLAGLSLVVISGEFAPGQVDFVFDISAGGFDGEGFFLLGDDNLADDLFDAGDLQLNFDFFGSPSTVLLVSGSTVTQGQDLDADDDGVLDVSPGSVIDGLSFTDGDATPDRNYAATVIPPDGVFTQGGAARETDGDGAFVPLAFASTAGDTPGASNEPETPGEDTPIYVIQGAFQVSALVGQAVSTVGIVTAVDSNGFYLQDATGDGVDATSDGIFVFTGGAPAVAVGDEARVSGTVSEFFPGGRATGNLSSTQIVGPVVAVLSSGNALPDAVEIGGDGRQVPTRFIFETASEVGLFDLGDFAGASSVPVDPERNSLDFFESLEGMRVLVEQIQTVSGTNSFGEIFGVAVQDSGNGGLNARGGVTIGTETIDGTDEVTILNADFNPERLQVQFDSGILPGFALPDVTTGQVLTGVVGVVSYDFGEFQINVTETFEAGGEPLSEEVTALAGGPDQLTIAAYNVLNLDPVIEVGLPASDTDDDVGAGRFEAIARQIIDNLGSPDILALQEVQDENGAEQGGVTSAAGTLALLAATIEALGGPSYAVLDNPFIGDGTNGGQPGGNIRTAFLYNPERVDFVEGSLDTVVDPADQQTNPANPFFDSRLPLVADFVFNGETVTVVSVHNSSRGGSTPLSGAIQLPVVGDEAAREAQSAAINAYVAARQAENPDANVAVLGDFNGFQFEAWADLLADGGDGTQELVNLTELADQQDAYSFIFNGNSQALDHAFITSNLAEAGFALDYVHVNAEFPEAGGTRASDHDPLVVALTIPGGVGGEVIEGTDGRDDLVGTDGDDTLVPLGGLDRSTGGAGADVFVTDANLPRDFVTDFELGEDLIDVSAWGVAILEGVQVRELEGGDVVIVGPEGLGLRVRGADGPLAAADFTAESFIFADPGDQTIVGTAGDDRLVGGNGDDALDGGEGGRDTLIGGEGVDSFILGTGERDRVADFELGIDLLDVSAWGVTSFEELTIRGTGGDFATVSAGGNSAYLEGRDGDIFAVDLTADRFVFAPLV